MVNAIEDVVIKGEFKDTTVLMWCSRITAIFLSIFSFIWLYCAVLLGGAFFWCAFIFFFLIAAFLWWTGFLVSPTNCPFLIVTNDKIYYKVHKRELELSIDKITKEEAEYGTLKLYSFEQMILYTNGINNVLEVANAISELVKQKAANSVVHKVEVVNTVTTVNKEELKTNENATPNDITISSADEIKKFKELYDQGIITEEEFNAKKNQLLGL